MPIKIKVEKKIAINLTPFEKIVCGNEDYEIEFEFDEQWEDKTAKIALFAYDENKPPIAQPFTGNICTVPPLENTTVCAVGVKTTDGQLKTTTPAYVSCLKCISDKGTAIPPPTKEVYDKLVDMINAGMLKGDKGDPFEYEDFTEEQLAELKDGLNTTVAYGNYQTMITAFNSLPKTAYTVGKNVMIVTLNVPDLWIASIEEKAVEYEYVSDEAFVETLKNNGTVQVGNYVFAMLETQKIDLSPYLKKIPFSKDTTVHGSDAGYVGRAYIVDHDGNQNSMALNAQAFNYTIPYRNYNANFYVGDPNLPYECTNRKYVDNLPDYLKLTDDSTAEDGTVTKGTRTKWLEWLNAVNQSEVDEAIIDVMNSVSEQAKQLEEAKESIPTVTVENDKELVGELDYVSTSGANRIYFTSSYSGLKVGDSVYFGRHYKKGIISSVLNGTYTQYTATGLDSSGLAKGDKIYIDKSDECFVTEVNGLEVKDKVARYLIDNEKKYLHTIDIGLGGSYGYIRIITYDKLPLTFRQVRYMLENNGFAKPRDTATGAKSDYAVAIYCWGVGVTLEEVTDGDETKRYIIWFSTKKSSGVYTLSPISLLISAFEDTVTEL